jgi:hypothetical protein
MKSLNSRNQGFSYFFLLDDRRIRMFVGDLKDTVPTDPDPQHGWQITVNYVLTWRIDMLGVVDTFCRCPFGQSTVTLDILSICYLKICE